MPLSTNQLVNLSTNAVVSKPDTFCIVNELMFMQIPYSILQIIEL
jgi:hypothetical protein